MESRQEWLSRLKNELSRSPLASNVAFGFILTGLEKLVELEFECPCAPGWNAPFSFAFFVLPAIMSFILMLIVKEYRCTRTCTWVRTKEHFATLTSSFIPAFVWLILLFFDGQYYMCAVTDWEGRFVIMDRAAPQKWCEPLQGDEAQLKELMLRSQDLFVKSQGIGLALLIFICMGLMVYLMRQHDRTEEEPQQERSIEMV